MKHLTRTIIAIVRPSNLVLSIGSVVAGLAAAALRGGITLSTAVWTLLCAVSIQISANLYFGYKRIRMMIRQGNLKDQYLGSSGYLVLKTLSEVFGILAFTMSFPLLTSLKWLAAVYIVLILGAEFLLFSGRRPLAISLWGQVFTFFMFGPVAVSGTAFIENQSFDCLTPIVLYSVIAGILAVNVDLSMQYMRRQTDIRDGVVSMLIYKGARLIKSVYSFNIILASIIMAVFPEQLGLDSRWLGLLLFCWLIISSFLVTRRMDHTSIEAAARINFIVLIQYLVVLIAALGVVIYNDDNFKFLFTPDAFQHLPF